MASNTDKETKKVTTPTPKKAVVKKTTALKKAEKTEKVAVTTETNASEVVVAKVTPAKTIQADVLDTTGKVIESMSLPGEIFGAKINPQLMAQAVRVYLTNQRQGTSSTKTRGEVTGSTRKIYRQKGTGRARHGGVRAPIFVKGGVAHGPKPRNFELKLSKKMKKASLFSALTAKLQDKQVKIISGLDKLEPKTKEMVKVLTQLELHTAKHILFVVPQEKDKAQQVIRISRNIDGVTYMSATQLTTYEVLNHAVLLMTKDAVDTLANHFLRKEEK